ncbi:acyl dehydratase [Aliiroseovarius sp. YM-037]|uniref:acyl dehydratase n=1 Tax=Aliiroseovarius sp. YM-037 TaxID=3341728 RepID=UPI003A811542
MHEAVGRTETIHCQLDPARAVAMHAILGLESAPPQAGDPLPPFWHQIYFWEPLPAEKLGRDGHIRIGGFIPDLGLPRRMWAAGQIDFHAPVEIGTPATKVTTIERVARKTGRTGPLAITSLRHDIRQNDALCISERQDLVYLPDREPGAEQIAPPIARTDEEERETHSFDTTLLFRYSAVTMNGHRIHYDLDYAKGVEEYAGLVVHGPLLAQRLIVMAERELGAVRRFTFRATAPLFHDEVATFCNSGADFWVRGPDGRQCMVATAE